MDMVSAKIPPTCGHFPVGDERADTCVTGTSPDILDMAWDAREDDGYRSPST
jgi:hypothetical protein